MMFLLMVFGVFTGAMPAMADSQVTITPARTSYFYLNVAAIDPQDCISNLTALTDGWSCTFKPVGMSKLTGQEKILSGGTGTLVYISNNSFDSCYDVTTVDGSDSHAVTMVVSTDGITISAKTKNIWETEATQCVQNSAVLNFNSQIQSNPGGVWKILGQMLIQ